MLIGVGALNPLFLYGLGAVAVPILIHLLLKKRRKRLRFSTLRFLKIAVRENARRNRIRQLLLLLLRMAVVALLVMAFARPFFRREAVGLGSGAKEVVFLVDRSMSMGVRSELGGTKLDHGLRYALDVVEQLTDDDRAAVIVFDAAPETVQAMTNDAGVVRAALGRIEPSAQATNIAAALAAAQELFDWESPRQKAIFLVSDLQQTGLGDVAKVVLRHDVFPEIPDLTFSPGNVSLSGLEAGEGFLVCGTPLQLTASVRNGSMQRRSVSVALTLDGAVVDTRRVAVEPGDSTRVTFEQTVTRPGVYGISLNADTDDALALDDHAYAALDVRRALRVLCVNGTPSKIPYFRETHYLEAALNPYRMSSEPGTTLFEPVVVDAEALGSRRLSEYDVVVLANVDYIEADAVVALEQYVYDGGGLVIFTGDRVSLIQYNRDLYKDGEGLLPASIEPPIGSLVDQTAFRVVASFDRANEVFRPFADPAMGDLSVPRFYRTHRVGPVEADSARILALFSDGQPMLVEKAYGTGRVLLVTTTVDADWNDMPKRKVYLPFIHRVVGYACGVAELRPETMMYFVGEPIPLPEGEVTVLDPEGQAIERAESGTLRETQAPGLYTVQHGDNEHVVAVNVLPAESDLTSCSVADFRQLLTGDGAKSAHAGLGADELGNLDECWPYIFAGLLVLMLAETWLASRTYI